MASKQTAKKGVAATRFAPQKKEQARSLAEEVRHAFNNAQQQQKPQKGQAPVEPAQQRKRGLGRGLSALLTSTVVSVTPPKEAEKVVAQPPQLEVESYLEADEQASEQVPSEAVIKPVEQLVVVAEIGEPQVLPPAAPQVVEGHLAEGYLRSETCAEEVGSDSIHSNELQYVEVSSLTPNPEQPRQYFNEEELNSLAASIKESGLLQPILVREDRSGGAKFEIIAGERRWRAATRAGLEVVPVIVKQLDDKEALQIGIIENVQRSNLNPIEEAEAYQRLIDDFGQTQSEVAETVGKDRTSIANGLRLLKLGRVVRDMIISGELSAGHGRALLMVPTEEQQIALARRIQKEGLSVRAAEKLATEPQDAAVVTKERPSKVPSSPTTQALEDRLRRGLGTKVRVNMGSKQKGEIRISFFSTEELESLLERLAV